MGAGQTSLLIDQPLRLILTRAYAFGMRRVKDPRRFDRIMRNGVPSEADLLPIPELEGRPMPPWWREELDESTNLQTLPDPAR